MKKAGRLHLRFEPRLLKQVQAIARRREVTLTSLVESFFKGLVELETQRPAVDDVEQV